MLENLFFKVITVAHGEEALGILQTNASISLVLTDYNMPVINGLELTKEIRKSFDKNQLGIIALSSNEDDEIVALFLKNGANDYIKKPFSKEEFYCRVNNSIESFENIQFILNSANRDFLTGLYNRRYFYSHIDEVLENAQENFLHVCIAMIDIDNFKSINDTYGHDVGDKVIIHLAEILQSDTKHEDLVARFGGEEFCIALVGPDADMMYDILERIRKNVAHSRVKVENAEISFTISLGAAMYQSGDAIDDVINQADMNLYEAKNSGKNKVVFKSE
jgi:diguanylate cyclase (GGDEF)-like protein